MRQSQTGCSKPEILRLLKRATTREVYRLLTRAVGIPDYGDLRPTRQDRNITLTAAARHLGVWPGTLSRLERGQSRNDQLADTYREWLASREEALRSDVAVRRRRHRPQAGCSGHCFVVVCIVVDLPFMARPVALPVLARLWRPEQETTKVQLGAELVGLLAAAFVDRRIDVVADGAYHGKPLRTLPETGRGPAASSPTRCCTSRRRRTPAAVGHG
ncbi:hypothetical protein ACIBG0_38155 [Nocardia sp. NPDC050630]|uniref:hypothetical protein n=1 Tax=Nocardia sp. NPDC050630 TaxID=3364321 RepID=UPI0037A2E6C7